MNQHTASWHEEEIEILNREWAKGASAAELAKLLGRTRNAIIGKIDRLGLSRVDEDRVPRRRLRTPFPKIFLPKRTLTGQFARVRPIQIKPMGLSIPFRDLRVTHCRFITGEIRGLETPFCGETITRGSFCEFHHQLTHTNARTASSRAVTALGPAATKISTPREVGAGPTNLGAEAA